LISGGSDRPLAAAAAGTVARFSIGFAVLLAAAAFLAAGRLFPVGFFLLAGFLAPFFAAAFFAISAFLAAITHLSGLVGLKHNVRA